MTAPTTRRDVLKYAGLIALAAQSWSGFPVSGAAPAGTSAGKGYGLDPDLLKRIVTWPRTLTADQLAMLAALCDIVLPAEPPHPSATTLGVPGFLDEWLSAPYPQMKADRESILAGLKALSEAMQGEARSAFAQADRARQSALFDRFCAASSTVDFARRLIELICAGYYTTREGHAAIGYVGNVALQSFPPPTPQVIAHLEEAFSELT